MASFADQGGFSGAVPPSPPKTAPPTGGPLLDATGRPQTGGPLTIDQGPAPPPPPVSGGFGGFTPVQGAGFGSLQTNPFGLGVSPQGSLPIGTISNSGQLIPNQNFAQTGQGGFSASPRILSNFEIQTLNRQLGTAGTFAQFNPNAFRARQQLGPFGFIADPSTFSRSQVPFIETRLNFENLLQAQQDRGQALNLLQEQRGQIGQRPGQQEALAVARRRLEQPEPFTPEEVSQQQSAIRQRGAQGLEAAQRQQAESLARQGVRGGVTAFQEAQQRQTAGRQTSDELQRLAIENALGRDVNEAQAVDRLRQITGEDESRTIAINNLLTELLSAQRGEFDLSALTAKERKSERGLLSKIGFF